MSYKLIEKVLTNYNFIEQIIDFEEDITMKTVEYTHGPINHTGGGSNPTEDEAIRLMNWQEKVKEIKRLIQKIHIAVDKLPLAEREIIEYYYMQGKSWIEVSKEVNFSIRHCHRLKRKAIKKLSIYCFIPNAKKYNLIIDEVIIDEIS